MDDQFADHRIVMRRHGIAAVNVGIETHAQSAGGEHMLDLAGIGLKVSVGIFGIDATFNRVTDALQFVLRERQRFPGGDPNLFFDQIHTGDHFGHRMFNLNPRIDFDKEKIVILVDDEFNGARVACSRHLGSSAPPLRKFRGDGASGRLGLGASSINF